MRRGQGEVWERMICINVLKRYSKGRGMVAWGVVSELGVKKVIDAGINH